MSKRPPAFRPNEKLSNLILEGGKGQSYQKSGAYEVIGPKGETRTKTDHTTFKPTKRPKK